MNILQKIRRNTPISRALLLMLAFSFLVLPLASWSSYGHSMQTTSQTDTTMEMSSNNSIIHCHPPSNNSNKEGSGKNCCDNVGSNQNCNNCPNSCTSTVFISFNSKNINQFINHYQVALNNQPGISSRRITPPFRPPITFLS